MYQTSERVMKPIRLGPEFPSRQVVFFGQALKRYDDARKHGYAKVKVSYPPQNEVLSFSISEITLWKSYVPENLPCLSDINVEFCPKFAAETKLLMPAKESDIDILEITGAPIMFVEYEKGRKILRNTNFLYQALDLYSRLIRKSIKAFERADNCAARNVISELTARLKTKSITDPEAIDLEEKINNIFVILTAGILQENN